MKRFAIFAMFVLAAPSVFAEKPYPPYDEEDCEGTWCDEYTYEESDSSRTHDCSERCDCEAKCDCDDSSNGDDYSEPDYLDCNDNFLRERHGLDAC